MSIKSRLALIRDSLDAIQVKVTFKLSPQRNAVAIFGDSPRDRLIAKHELKRQGFEIAGNVLTEDAPHP